MRNKPVYRRGGRPGLVAMRLRLGLNNLSQASAVIRLGPRTIAKYEAGYIPYNSGKLVQLCARYGQYARSSGYDVPESDFDPSALCPADFPPKIASSRS